LVSSKQRCFYCAWNIARANQCLGLALVLALSCELISGNTFSYNPPGQLSR
jgi:hypothetical protein